MQVARQRSRNGKANKSSRPVKKEITIPELSSTPSFCRDGEKPPKLKKQGDFEWVCTDHWTCRVCIRPSLTYLFLMRPSMAEAHERSAYHRFKISDPLYDLTRMDPDESDLAWTGPSPVDQPYDYLKSKERAEYYAEKEKKFLQANPDWDKYDPEKDEFLHPGVSGEAGWSGGWRKNHGGSEQNGRSRGMKSGRGGRSGRLQNASRRAKQAEDGADMISIKANRKGLGYFTYDPIPKPVHDWVPWIKQLPGPEDTQGWDEKAVDWDEKFNVPEDESRPPPLDAKIDANCFTWGQKFANWAHLNAKETEKMFLFLALPTIVKVERVELLAARLSDPNNRPLVVDETQYWNISPPPPSKPNPDLTTKGC